MGIAQYIKVIGRGSQGARALDAAQAEDLMGQVLDGQASDLEVGAFALAMRIKGENVDELRGFLAAVHARCLPLTSERPVIVLPTYNGARRLPNLTPLLALRLAQEGARVLIHGPVHDFKRVSSADVFHDLGLPLARSAAEVGQAWSRREPALMPIDALCPPLARLLDVRWVIGVRNSGHTVAKILAPLAGAATLRVVNYTHPEYGTSLAAWARASQANAMLLRGTEGEPVADARRLPAMDVYLDGLLRTDLSCAAQEGVLAEMPLLPRGTEAASTALYIQAVLGGEKPAPAPLEKQVDLLLRALSELAAGARQQSSA